MQNKQRLDLNHELNLNKYVHKKRRYRNKARQWEYEGYIFIYTHSTKGSLGTLY